MAVIISDELTSILRNAASKGDKIADTLLFHNNLAYLTTAQGNYLAFKADECQLSYRPANRIDTEIHRYAGDHWHAQGRMTGRPGRVIRKFLTGQALEGLTDVDFEQFTNNLAAFRDNMGEIRLVSGTAIRDWYASTNYAPYQGTLANSCMRYSRCQSYFGIYTANPSVCQMAILTKVDQFGKELLYGRALVWTLTDGRKMIDRIYGNDKVISYMTQWAREQGFIDRAGNYTYSARVEVQLQEWRFGAYPYCDTLFFLDQKQGKLSNLPFSVTARRFQMTLHGTEGTDFLGVALRYRIPVIRRYDETYCEIAYALVDGMTVRGAQRRLTNRLALSGQYGFEIDYPEGNYVKPIVRGMAAFPERSRWYGERWRKMTDLEMRYFGMQVGTTLDD